MNRKIKALGLALAAVLALTAVMAATASAQFTSNKTHTIISGGQEAGTNYVFSAGAGFGSISCSTVTFQGTMSNTSESSMALTPTYGGCKDSLGRTVHVHNNTTLTATDCFFCVSHTTGTKTYTTTDSNGFVVCTTTVSSQTNTPPTKSNLGGTNGIKMTIHSENVISTTAGGFLNCGISNGEHKAGTYDGTIILTGKDTSGAAASISVD